MASNNKEFWRHINPATDLPAALAILLGIFIVVLVDELALKLIGGCVSALGILFLMMIISQRMRDVSISATKPVSETTSFKTTIKQDPSTKRLIFDDFQDSFGTDEFSAEDDDGEDDLQEDESDALKDTSRSGAPLEEAVTAAAPTNTPSPINIGSKSQSPQPAKRTFGDDDVPTQESLESETEGFRIVGNVTSSSPKPTESLPEITGETEVPSADQPAATHKQPEEQTLEEKNTSAAKKKSQKSTPSDSEKIAPDTESAARPEQPTEEEATEVAAAKKTAPKSVRKKIEIPITEIFEETPNSLRNEPRKEFDYLIKRVLTVIRTMVSARTTMFCWVNFGKQQLVLESIISDIESSLQQARKIPLGTDVISQIAENGTPEILSEINTNAELDLLPYYANHAQTRSFVGVPVYFNNNVVGVLTADSEEDNAYNAQTVSFLGHFTKLISGLIQGYTEKYDLVQSSKAVDSFTALFSAIHKAQDQQAVGSAMLDEVELLVNCRACGIVLYSDQKDQWLVASMRANDKRGLDTGNVVAINESLIGQSISTGELRQYKDLHPGTVAVCTADYPDQSVYTFVPLVTATRCYGAIFIENSTPSALAEQDLKILELVGRIGGDILEQTRVHELLEGHSMVEEHTGIPNRQTFESRLSEEYARATDHEMTMSLALVKIDQYNTYAGNTVAEQFIEESVVDMVRKNLRVYDVLGRFDDSCFGIILIRKNGQEAKLWAEQLRNVVATTRIPVHGKDYTVTLSIGVSEYTNQPTVEDLYVDAQEALKHASAKANNVSLFS